MYRTTEDNALGVPVQKWNKPATGRCDYPFAFVYWRIGLDRYRESSAQFVSPEGGVERFAQTGLEIAPDGSGKLSRY